jgi:hypothetical protein|tara:strand:- start:490 stop:966 length:477 start_codon:yes stop_codon:yes gene_type:complete
MSFWATAGEPLRKNRYLLNFLDTTRMEVKTITLPNFETEPSEHKLMNHMFKVPGIGKWTDVTMTLVMTKNILQSTLLSKTGYDPVILDGDTIEKGSQMLLTRVGTPIITILDELGAVIQTWTLYGAFISSINYGDLDYSTDDFITVDLTLSIDYAIIA